MDTLGWSMHAPAHSNALWRMSSRQTQTTYWPHERNYAKEISNTIGDILFVCVLLLLCFENRIDRKNCSSRNKPVKSNCTQCIRLHCFKHIQFMSQLFLPGSNLWYLWWWHFWRSTALVPFCLAHSFICKFVRFMDTFCSVKWFLSIQWNLIH